MHHGVCHKDRTHKQLILNITLIDTFFYLDCFVQVVQCHHLCQFLRFWLHHIVCSLSLFQEQRQTSMKEVEEGVTWKEKAREKRRVPSFCVQSRTCTCLCVSFCLEFLNKVICYSQHGSRKSVEHFYPSHLGLMPQCLSHLIYHAL